MRLTQKDIANRLGVSLITVSRALNGSGYVSKELKTRILSFAKENNYIPHKASQVLVRNRVRKIALFSSSLPGYFWGDIGKGIEVAANQILAFNYDVEYHMIAESDSQGYIATVKEEIEGGVAALAFVNQRLYDMRQVFDLVDRSAIPYITFNIDAPESNRICYVGSDYRAGGRLAAEFIGKTIRLKERPRVLVVTTLEREDRYSDVPDINGERLEGFLAVMHTNFPNIECDVQYITTKLKVGYQDTQIFDLLESRQGEVDAVYLIAAFNTAFLEALARLDYRNATTVLHDIDSSSLHHLETRLLSAVIYQNPILQGYYAVKMLEHIVESNQYSGLQDVEIVSNLVMAENKNLHRNHYLFTT